MRNYALSFTAITFRIFVGLAFLTDHMVIYTIGSYVSFLPNIIAVEFWIKYKYNNYNKGSKK